MKIEKEMKFLRLRIHSVLPAVFCLALLSILYGSLSLFTNQTGPEIPVAQFLNHKGQQTRGD